MIDILIFAALAAFLVYRLRSVLGRRDGHNGPSDFSGFGQRNQNDQPGDSGDKVINMPDRGAGDQTRDRTGESEAAFMDSPADSGPDFGEGPAAEGMKKIHAQDPSFEPKSFLEGGRGAFEWIISAFAKGDTKTLRPLLADEVYADFAGAIEARSDANETLDTQLIGITSAEIVEAELSGKTAFVTVKFVSEQINVTKDAEGRIVEGDPNEVVKITDIWTFARNVSSRDPNWKLVATQTPN